MAYYNLHFLNNLNVIKVKELIKKEASNRAAFILFFNIINLFIILSLNDFDFDLSF